MTDDVFEQRERRLLFEKWKERRSKGYDLPLRFFASSYGMCLPGSVGAYFSRPFHDLQSTVVKTVVVGGIIVVFGTILGLVRIALNERRFKIAEKLGRMPTDKERSGIFAMEFNGRYLLFGVAIIFLLMVAILAISFLFSSPSSLQLPQ